MPKQMRLLQQQQQQQQQLQASFVADDSSGLDKESFVNYVYPKWAKFRDDEQYAPDLRVVLEKVSKAEYSSRIFVLNREIDWLLLSVDSASSAEC